MPSKPLHGVIRYLHRIVAGADAAHVADEQLLERFVTQRDEAAFELLVWRHGKMVLGVCRRMLRDAHAADDAFQASFLALARRAACISKRTSVGGWLYKVAYRVALQAKTRTVKRTTRETPLPDVSLPAAVLDPGADAERRELELVIDDEVNRLPEKYRLPLVLCYFEGKSNGEAARELGCPLGTLQSRLTRAREKLCRRLTRRGVAPSLGLLAVVLSESTTSAFVPMSLVTSTARVAAQVAAGQAVGAASAGVAALTEEVLTAMWMTKLRIIAVVLVVSLLASGTGLFTHLAWGEKPRTIEKANRRPQQALTEVRIEDANTAPAEPTSAIRGVVIDEGGRPVAGARVNVKWFGRASEDITTAADGSFSFQIGFPMRRGETVHASADGGARQGLARFEESFTPSPLPIRVVLKPARNVTVRVSDAKGSPVEGAAVEIPSASAYGFVAQAVTDARGTVQFRLPADAEVRHVIALKPGLGFDFFENYRSWPPLGTQLALPEKVSLTLDGARSVQIKAIDSAGRPLAGVPFVPVVVHKRGKLGQVNLTGKGIASATTDVDGIARFEWIPKRIEEHILFTSTSWDYHSVGSPMIYPSEADAAVTVRVLRNTRVAGKIFLPDGTPAAGVLVSASGTGTGNLGGGLTRTAADGSYTMHVAPDQIYTIAFLDPRGAAPPLTSVIVREGIPREGLDLRMAEGAQVRGRVTKASDGRQAAREQVSIELPGEEVPEEFRSRPQARYQRPVRLWAITDEDGRYAVQLAPGEYTFSAGYAGPRTAVRITGREAIVRDLVITGETMRARTSMTLTGVVVERTGAGRQPVAGAEVQEMVTRTTGFPPAKAVTDAQGRFALDVGMRPQLLYARSPDGTLAGYLEVAATGEVEFPVSAAATVLGRVVDPDGHPVPSRRIGLTMIGGAGAFEHQFLGWQLYTDETGAFLFSGLVPGSEGILGVPHRNDLRDERKAERREFKVRGPEPIVLPNIIVPTDPPAK